MITYKAKGEIEIIINEHTRSYQIEFLVCVYDDSTIKGTFNLPDGLSALDLMSAKVIIKGTCVNNYQIYSDFIHITQVSYQDRKVYFSAYQLNYYANNCIRDDIDCKEYRFLLTNAQFNIHEKIESHIPEIGTWRTKTDLNFAFNNIDLILSSSLSPRFIDNFNLDKDEAFSCSLLSVCSDKPFSIITAENIAYGISILISLMKRNFTYWFANCIIDGNHKVVCIKYYDKESPINAKLAYSILEQKFEEIMKSGIPLILNMEQDALNKIGSLIYLLLYVQSIRYLDLKFSLLVTILEALRFPFLDIQKIQNKPLSKYYTKREKNKLCKDIKELIIDNLPADYESNKNNQFIDSKIAELFNLSIKTEIIELFNQYNVQMKIKDLNDIYYLRSKYFHDGPILISDKEKRFDRLSELYDIVFKDINVLIFKIIGFSNLPYPFDNL
jgi:hypothetical protein